MNLAEVLQKAEQHGVETEGLDYDLEALGLEFRDLDVALAIQTAELWSPGSGLSLGDRACLALVGAEKAIAVTADAHWVGAGLDVDVHVIRSSEAVVAWLWIG